MIRRILSLCARDTGHEVMYSQLEQALLSFQKNAHADSWNQLLQRAEQQGLAPLLYHHSQQIPFHFPANFTRLLRSLYLRSRQANALRTNAVTEILTWFAAADIQAVRRIGRNVAAAIDGGESTDARSAGGDCGTGRR